MGLLAASNVGVALIAAGASLIGVIVGGLITGGVALKAEDKRQEFAREMDKIRQADEHERERRTQKAAARMIHSELIYCAAAMEAMAGTRRGRPTATLLLPVSAWEAQSQHLALSLPLDVWRQVHSAYEDIEHGLREFESTEQWSNDDTLTKGAATLDEAVAAIGPYMSDDFGTARSVRADRQGSL